MQPDATDPVVNCTEPERIVGVINSLMPLLSADVRRLFNQLKLALLQEHGVRGLFDRLNGRRVSEILAKERLIVPPPIIAGERDGVSFTVYPAKRENHNAVDPDE